MQNIINQTPVYIWIIFIYVLLRGYQATKSRSIPISRLFVMPIVFTLLKIQQLHAYDLLPIAIAWALGTMIGSAVAYYDGKVSFKTTTNKIHMPGSKTTLVLLLILFTCKYCLGMLKVVQPEHHTEYALADIIITFLFAGFTLGKAVTYTIRFFHKKRM